MGKTQNTLNKSEEAAVSLQSQLQVFREDNARLTISLEFETKQFEEKMSLLNESRDQLGVAFKNIANEIFDDKSKKFTATNKESLSAVLNPLQEKIVQFEKRVEDTYDKEAKERFSLAKEIENLQKLNSKISEDAVNLTNALKGDNKTQGSWGEFVLESILEKSGLVKGREYDVQVSLKAEDGSKSQPDVIVHLPESRDIIIDSKVSLKAWDGFCASEDEGEKSELLSQHIQSVRMHVKSLSGKDYQNLAGINSLDYVFLFMPIEAAYSIAIQNDPELSQHAFERNIIFVGPTTLLTTLKTVQNLWRLAQQNRNANEIAEKAGALYDKFVAFVDDLDEVGVKIDASKKSFEKAQNKLLTGRGNLIKRAEALKELGAKTSKKQKPDVVGSALEDDKRRVVSKAEIEPSENGDKKTRH
ncbi:MAG: DNA recombination protein RmuC [Gammaproteobacteria bacterium]|nr:DNA recombination protein RmuC [Gammaproteobacteria bacterium]